MAEFSSRLLVGEDALGKLFEEGEPPMYHDPLLADDPFAYAQFLSELHRAKIITFSRKTPICINGFFFVLRKGGRLRMICDCRRANARFVKPERTVLGSVESWAKVRIPRGSDMFVAQEEHP